ncbi:MAG TPA: dihydropteroate synthase-like protein [Methanothrix sp.]|nr:dihydropteroate synthase-like protein [Methanothrix sp.]HOK57688.1 dihydropteroate synthase-like protein [Methanothrix sp.]HOL43091.1 dihydropteroate synthase-like protein [Methanothrix sp.]HPO88093.1 dihydropteroate synthase-like protein [Methanothrix sp.]
MKVLLLTGRLAEADVRNAANSARVPADVLVLDLDIAAFITPGHVRKAAPIGYDLIMLPGLITSDFSEVEQELGTKIRLGPKHAADITYILDHMDEIELSSRTPACALIAERLAKNAEETLSRIERNARPPIVVRGIGIGGGSRMKVLAEIVDATRLEDGSLEDKIRYYESQGADMIDLGLPLDALPDDVKRVVRIARRVSEMPVSIDTLRPDLILAGVDAGADLVLSIDGSNMHAVADALLDGDVPAVVIPGPGSLESNISAAIELGLTVIADPVLSPPLGGLAASIARYIDFRRAHPDTPLFLGVGNVTELIDADSHGANAILAAIGEELGASILFTPEYSRKAQGSVRELRRAAEMMALARERRSPPKDLGRDLLILKEKRPRPGLVPPDHLEVRMARQSSTFVVDPAGSFRIGLCGDEIVAVHDRMVIKGRTAREILDTAIDLNLVSRLDHAAYLGRELEKAEIALRLGKSYTQDEELF